VPHGVSEPDQNDSECEPKGLPKVVAGDNGNVAAADAVKQMIEGVWWKIVAPNSWHG